MSNVPPLVLITTATKPPPGVFALEMTNFAKRIITAKAGVFFWSALGAQKIVIADATGQTLLNQEEVQLLKQMNVEVEQVSYLQNIELVKTKGKGYGEGALIKFALHTSLFLQSCSNFFKCTGKVYCRNFGEIQKVIQQNNLRNMFWREAHYSGALDSRFFYTSKDFCENFVLPAYENVDDKAGIMAEYCIQQVAQEHLKPGTSLRPILSGFSGSVNKPYMDSSLGLFDHNFPCWGS